ncbi:hypothetical protein NAEGRDRAFT_58318 [Naegleria gruberi]|uniref:F-box/LRR-repeat protein 15/At3g58940/PEG3-like LRR domain-containing protein n=1 Tax=Naegleria gruberi TaxID=5762 RepID=D2VIJ6_NAEGR|nr:uncharacterized protein NAEGRDRAFT_58318 [Naegleria gruberi]EFC43280.1 hypothetical protein NAEGRDRAFT_58318 [Naegleria gruberi]|eukprot:XP_002676024.1 hypothetical protein NAEGRDRAFT_58318 [Naegleria gruberi strain NEG-M]
MLSQSNTVDHHEDRSEHDHHSNNNNGTSLSIDCIEHILSCMRLKDRISISLINHDWNRGFEKSVKTLMITKTKSKAWLQDFKKFRGFIKRFPEIQNFTLESPIEVSRAKDETTMWFSMNVVQTLLDELPSSLKSFTLSHFALGLSSKTFELVIPESKQLRELTFINCKRAHGLTVSNCGNLRSLSVSWGSFFIKNSGFEELKNLRYLNLSNNKVVTDELLDNIVKNCPSLEKLVLVGCLNIQSPFKDVNLNCLKYLDLSATNIRDSCIENICSGTALNLEELRLRTCMGLVSPSFKDIPSIKIIGSQFNAGIQTASFHKLRRLEKIDLDGNICLKKIYISQCKSIIYLDVSKTLINDEALEEIFSECPELKQFFAIKCYKLKSPKLVHSKLEEIRCTNSCYLTKNTVFDCPNIISQHFIGTILGPGEFTVPLVLREDVAEAAELAKAGMVKNHVNRLNKF